jgi:hypothetical protein
MISAWWWKCLPSSVERMIVPGLRSPMVVKTGACGGRTWVRLTLLRTTFFDGVLAERVELALRQLKTHDAIPNSGSPICLA